MAKISIKKIRESIIEQLKAKGADIPLFQDQINAYIFFTTEERKMQQDISKKGLSYPAVSATGKKYIKDNPSIKNAVMYNKQRLNILAQLGLTTSTVMSDVDDEL